MSLSNNVTEHLNDALSSMRQALWCAAKNERPSSIVSIAKILGEIEMISTQDSCMDTIDRVLKDIENKDN